MYVVSSTMSRGSNHESFPRSPPWPVLYLSTRVPKYYVVRFALLPLCPLPFSPLPLCALLVITAAELSILIHILHRQPRRCLSRQRRRLTWWWRRRRHTRRRWCAAAAHHLHKVAGILRRVQVLVNEAPQGRVGGVDELVRREAALVAQARVGAGLEHHADEGGAKVALRGRFRVEPADGGVQGRVPLEAVDGVALKVGLVEEEVDDFVFPCLSVHGVK